MPEQAAAGALLELTPYAVSSSPHFTEWLHEQQVSLAFTNIDRLFLIGLKADGRLAVSSAAFPRCMELAADDAQTLYLVTSFQIWRLENALPPGQLTESGCDAFYLP